MSVSVAGHPFVRLAADAVIVATSTGSTAYSFSAGGPIVSPNVEGFLVVPAAAHSTFNRALVLSADEEVTLEVLPTSGNIAVEVDGTISGHLSPGDRISVTAVRAAARVVRLGATTFYERAPAEAAGQRERRGRLEQFVQAGAQVAAFRFAARQVQRLAERLGRLGPPAQPAQQFGLGRGVDVQAAQAGLVGQSRRGGPGPLPGRRASRWRPRG